MGFFSTTRYWSLPSLQLIFSGFSFNRLLISSFILLIFLAAFPTTGRWSLPFLHLILTMFYPLQAADLFLTVDFNRFFYCRLLISSSQLILTVFCLLQAANLFLTVDFNRFFYCRLLISSSQLILTVFCLLQAANLFLTLLQLILTGFSTAGCWSLPCSWFWQFFFYRRVPISFFLAVEFNRFSYCRLLISSLQLNLTGFPTAGC